MLGMGFELPVLDVRPDLCRRGNTLRGTKWQSPTALHIQERASSVTRVPPERAAAVAAPDGLLSHQHGLPRARHSLCLY